MSKYEEASVKFVGSGGVGHVESIVRSWDQKRVARKIIRFDTTDEKGKQKARNEYRTQRYFDHPNIARYFDSEWRDGEARFYMEFFKDGSLDTLVNASGIRQKTEPQWGQGKVNLEGDPHGETDKPIPQNDVWAIVYQLSAAIAYCHTPEKNLRVVEDDESDEHSMPPTTVYHRDIKPQNVLRASEVKKSLEVYKLCDFGLSFVFEDSKKPVTYAGTPAYKPPEISQAKGGEIAWTTKCDVYSLGCTLYEICNGKPPFLHSPENASEAAKYQTISKFYDDHELISCIKSCLSFDKDQRPEAAKIREIARAKLMETDYKDALQYQSLLEAVEGNFLEKVKSYAKGYKEADSVPYGGHTPLHRAVQYRKVEVVEVLLKEGLSALAETEDGETPLHMALESTMESKHSISSESPNETLESEEEHMSRMLVDSCDKSRIGIWRKFYPRGWTLLHLAAAANSVHIVQRVLQKDPSWNLPTHGKQWSLIHIAARNGHIELLRFLLEQNNLKATIEKSSHDEATPLFAACKRGHAEAVELLLRYGANINVRTAVKIRVNETRDGMTGLHIAALGGHTETVQTLLSDTKIRISGAKTNHDETALHLAVQDNHKSCPDVINALGGPDRPINIEATAKFEINGTMTEKCTALHMAAEKNNVQGTSKLLELKAKPNAETKDGDTALHLAARKGFKAIAEVLLNKNAQADKLNRWKATPLHEAIKNSTTETPEGRVKEKEGMTETAKFLIGKDWRLVSETNRDGDTALHVAASKGNTTVFQAAYVNCSSALVNMSNYYGDTALHIAARKDRWKIVDFLLKRQAIDPARKNGRGETVLQVATGKSEAFLEDFGQ